MYEYVKKFEYAPVRKELERIIKCVQIKMREKYGLTFRFQLIGSGQRHLVTRVRGGNSGYDFDYNLIISHPGNGYSYKADILKRDFIAAFKNALRGTSYSFPNSCDFAIIYYDIFDENDGYFYLRNNKKQNKFEFVFRSLNCDIEEKVDNICTENNGWNDIRKEYIKLKNINVGKDKHSFSLYIEAVNNVYNQMFYQ